MFGVGKKVSFSVVIAILLGWGVFGILFMQASNTLWQAQAYEIDRPAPLPTGVKLSLQVDKKIYRAGDTVLLALRNDSRATIWLAEHADGCSGAWWRVEVLAADGETWTPVPQSKDICQTKQFGLAPFVRHTLQNAEWKSVVPNSQLGNIVDPALVGTYRIIAPYLKGVAGVATESDWGTVVAHTIVSPSFTIQ